MLKIPPDYTFLLQIALFAVLWFGLKRLLFDPMVALLEERERRTSGARAEATRITAAVQDSGAEYDRRMQEVRRTLQAEADAARSTIVAEEQKILAEARNQASAQFEQMHNDLTRLADSARPALATEAQDLAAQMLERIAGRSLL
jgi:F-type H+-transporting ATPase subunit b